MMPLCEAAMQVQSRLNCSFAFISMVIQFLVAQEEVLDSSCDAIARY